MERASRGIRDALAEFEQCESVGDALLVFTRQIECDYAKSQDIALFIFALRSFFCWHRAVELAEDRNEVARVRGLWLDQNEEIYANWLASAQDNPETLKWAKWTFQAKTSLLAEFLEACNRPTEEE
jgi:hypothetical protein